MKAATIIIASLSLALAQSCNEQSSAPDNQQNPPQMQLAPDSSLSEMPVAVPDTTRQEQMPVVKPPINIQPK